MDGPTHVKDRDRYFDKLATRAVNDPLALADILARASRLLYARYSTREARVRESAARIRALYVSRPMPPEGPPEGALLDEVVERVEAVAEGDEE